MKRLNIFVDETGEFGFSNGSSDLYGVSFTFHEHNDDIILELNKLNDRLKKIGYMNMIHMADLIMRRGDYSRFSISKRKSIFNSIYQFSRKIPVKYKTIIINKKYTDNARVLKQKLSIEINNMVKEHENYFNSFDSIVIYYDNGQEILGTILDAIFSRYEGFEHIIDFNHKEKRLFQVQICLLILINMIINIKIKCLLQKAKNTFLV